MAAELGLFRSTRRVADPLDHFLTGPLGDIAEPASDICPDRIHAGLGASDAVGAVDWSST